VPSATASSLTSISRKSHDGDRRPSCSQRTGSLRISRSCRNGRRCHKLAIQELNRSFFKLRDKLPYISLDECRNHRTGTQPPRFQRNKAQVAEFINQPAGGFWPYLARAGCPRHTCPILPWVRFCSWNWGPVRVVPAVPGPALCFFNDAQRYGSRPNGESEASFEAKPSE
jgi:hypothetical protein